MGAYPPPVAPGDLPVLDTRSGRRLVPMLTTKRKDV